MTAACPACAAAPLPETAPTATVARPDLVLHLPDIHCAACIASVEAALARLPGIREARVNLTRKRVLLCTDGRDAGGVIDALAAEGHRAQLLDTDLLAGRDSTGRDLILRIGVSGFAMMNVMLLSVAVWSGAAQATAQLFHLVSALIALPAVAYAARPFFASALRAVSAGRLNMDVPISLAIALATLVSLMGALEGAERPGWFDAALALTFFLLIGRYLDHAGRQAARSAAAELAALEAPQALRLRDGHEEIVRAADLVEGDLIRIRPGDRVPADGVVTEGESDLDRSALTGESRPQAIGPGGEVSAGETNLSGPLILDVRRAGADTRLRRLADLVAAAENQRSRHSGLADRAARIYAPVVHLLGAGAFLGWWWATADAWHALDVAISVLVITCPCALGLAVPAVSTVTTGWLFRRGILVKSHTALERMSEIDLVVFDKTGTLTTGELALAGDPPDHVLALAAGLARGSAHPLSRAICAAARARGLSPAPVERLRELPGRGVEGEHDGHSVALGNPGWLGLAADSDETLVALRDASGALFAFCFEETPRADAQECIAELRALGYDVALLSGDAPAPVTRLADALGIARFEARMSPEEKMDWLRARRAEGRTCLMVGDGLNDTGGLAEAHASIAPGSALDAARNVADLVLLRDNLSAVPDALGASCGAVRRMRQNIWLSLLYNAVSIPLALAGFATPWLAALAMSSSSLTVSLNAARRIR
ncbi:heavy metal translocating P-type ATPase [Limimaricola hongkongensis]|uniref:Type cbb3 cytochrome oxidase biogenesis protein CcoI/ Copper-translocating P-type ATPase n=1 Tax=Limimaricola hongkongensis DSM 17492 TaxID=1122180 RepID=A0A017HG64_9RHOB|nr:heavy metal translocating P-type ATPase [Limimaricola hongkongensis]EYD73123.1 Type cbb3 cytochrome oxidase biogenesis protein CcoI/ Copper-translocating P-type ATPase [Limimaricola hongkongensis DSM 17492]